jgi:hypothetical protein
MSQFKATANAHIRRDMEAGGRWACECQACQEIRSLVGMDKTLEVRNLVRELTEIEARLDGLPDGPAKRSLMESYLKVYDRLADKMAEDAVTGEA